MIKVGIENCSIYSIALISIYLVNERIQAGPIAMVYCVAFLLDGFEEGGGSENLMNGVDR